MSEIGIICIHSDKMLQTFFKEALTGSKVSSVRNCSTLKEAYDLFSKIQSPIIVIDTFIPGSSGFDVLKGIRKMNDSIAIVFLARFQTRTLIEKAFRLGASDIVPYPMSKDFFINIIDHRLKNISEQEIQFNI